MAYAPYSSTAPNPPVLVFQPLAFGGGSTFYGAGSSNVGGNLWLYMSTHLQTDVGTSDFISDGQALGMKVKDIILANSLSSGLSFHRVSAVGSTYVSCSPGLVVSSAS
jgi:hypothetical protein